MKNKLKNKFIKTSLFTILFIFASFFIQKAKASSMIIRLRTQEYDNSVRFVVELSKETKYNIFSLKDPSRIVIDLENTEPKVTNSNFKTGTTIDSVRIGRFKNNTARIVLDLNSTNPRIIKKFALKPSKDNQNYRVVVDLEKNKEDLLGNLIAENVLIDSENTSLDTLIDTLIDQDIPVKKSPVIKHDNKIEKEEIIIRKDGKNYTIKKKSTYIIVIDAGHGGKDSGAIGYRGTKEKLITLTYAKAIKEGLDRTRKYKVYLTRAGDYFIPLGDRVKKARQYGADLFISVHADSSSNRKAKGLSIYSLSQEASDKRTAALAQAENKADIIGGMDLFGEYQDTINVLVDLSRRTSMNLSSRFAEIMIESFKYNNVKMLSGPHKYGNFAVLLAPDIPSVLIELAFLSNPEDEKMMRGSAYRKKIVDSVVKGVNKYFNM